MKEDIKRIISEFGGMVIIYLFAAPFIMTIIRGIGVNHSIASLLSPILPIVILLLPTMRDLKVSPLETNGKIEYDMSIIDMIVLALVSWALWHFISSGLSIIIKIEIIENILKLQQDSITEYASSISKVSTIISTLITVITLNLIFRGVLLNSLRKYGDVFAVIISSIMYSIFGNSFMLPFNLVISLIAGTIYVLTNDIKAPILFSLLIYFTGTTIYENMINLFGSWAYFHGILLIISLLYLASRRNFRSYISQLKNQYREERNDNKGKYAVVFKSEAFIALCLITVLGIAMTVVSEIMK